MIVVDSSVWIDHIRAGEPLLDALLMREQALMHPHVLGEIALGSIRDRSTILARLGQLPAPTTARDDQLLRLIDERELFTSGVGYTDAHLLASTLLTGGAALWTRDKRLSAQAERLGIAYAA